MTCPGLEIPLKAGYRISSQHYDFLEIPYSGFTSRSKTTMKMNIY